MPRFEIEANGKRYEVEAPSAEAAMQALSGGQPQASGPQRPPGYDEMTIPPPRPSVPFGEGLRGTVGSMLEGVPIAGPALLEAGNRLSAMRSDQPYEQALEETKTRQENFSRDYPSIARSGQAAGGMAAMNALGATGTGARFLGVTGRNMLERTIAGGASGAAISTADAAARGNDPATGAAVGATLGAAAPVFGRFMSRVITPFPANQERRAAADILRQEGVTPTAGQASGSRRLRYLESELGGGATEQTLERQGEDFTAAALRRVGGNDRRATPEVVNRAFERVGGQFDDLTRRHELRADQRLVADLNGAVAEYNDMQPESLRAPVIERLANDVRAAVQRNGTLDGTVYQRYRSRIEALARGAQQKNIELADALRGIRHALDEGMERTIRASGDLRDIAAWQQARRQYRNLLVIERAMGPSDDAALGIISPARLRNAAVQLQGRRGYVRGRSEFADLARAGTAVMQPLPQSGTAPRLAAHGLPNIAAAIAGGSLGGYAHGGEGAMLGGLAGAAAPYLIGRGVMSQTGQAYLGNQLLVGPAGQRFDRATMAAMLGSGLPLYPVARDWVRK